MESMATAADPERWTPRATPSPRCPLEATLDVFDGRWKPLIVWRLFWGARPFCDLMRSTEGINKKTLRRQLAELERHGLVHRRLRPGGRRRAEYALTPSGETLKPIVAEMYAWGISAMRGASGSRRAADPQGRAAESSNGAGSPDEASPTRRQQKRPLRQQPEAATDAND